MRSPAQLDLPVAAEVHMPSRAELARLRVNLPATVQFGTAGWAYPDWAGLVWSSTPSREDLERDGLVEYAAHPLLTTMYLESGADAQPSERDLRRYASLLPPTMHCVFQAHPEVTTPRFTHSERALWSGRIGANPHFLDPRFFTHEILPTYLDVFGDRLGPFLFAFPPYLAREGIDADTWAARLDHFLAALPGDVAAAVEPREPALLTTRYAEVLMRRGAAHVFTTWPGMPPLAEQAQNVPLGPEIIVHVTGPGRFARCHRIQAPQPRLRAAVVDLLRATRGIPAYVLVHNEAEGSAPLTVLSIARSLVRADIENHIGFK